MALDQELQRVALKRSTRRPVPAMTSLHGGVKLPEHNRAVKNPEP